MKRLGIACAGAMMGCLLMGAADDGSWQRRVPAHDRERANPLPDQAAAAQAGAHLYAHQCAPCHGAGALGKPGRPPLLSDRVEQASDGELAWILRNGSPWNGMPSWQQLPDAQRWQLVAYLRLINTPGLATFDIRSGTREKQR
ncbi:MAG TPA: cytochrome c [Acidobacteriaceae bacterium]